MERNTEQNGMEYEIIQERNKHDKKACNGTKNTEWNMEHLKQNGTEYVIQILFLIQIIPTVKAPTSEIRGR